MELTAGNELPGKRAAQRQYAGTTKRLGDVFDEVLKLYKTFKLRVSCVERECLEVPSPVSGSPCGAGRYTEPLSVHDLALKYIYC
jgi:hypothetical protein